MNPSLAQQVPSQHDFAAALLGPGLDVPAGLKDSGGQDTQRRFAVHRNNVVVCLIDALAESFPVTQALVGAEFFRAMARECVVTTPPRSPVLTDYATGFPDFIARFLPAVTVPYLADVARIEALRIRAYHAADAAPIADAGYRQLFETPERLAATRVALHPACSWFRSPYATYSIWHAHQGLQDMAEARIADIDVMRGEDVLIARPLFDVVATALPQGAAAWLDALGQGQTFAAASGHAHAASAAADDSALFAVLIRFGLAIGFKHTQEN